MSGIEEAVERLKRWLDNGCLPSRDSDNSARLAADLRLVLAALQPTSDLREAVARVIAEAVNLALAGVKAPGRLDLSDAGLWADRILSLIPGNVGAAGGEADLRAAMREACDLLAERTYGSHARSPGHNARLVLEAALSPPVGGGEDQGCSGPDGPPGLASGNSPNPSTSSAAGAEADLSAVLRELYAMEINCGLSSFWDGGWTVWLGDENNGRYAEANIERDDFDKIAPWLLAETDKLIERWRSEGRAVERRQSFRVVTPTLRDGGAE